MTVNEILPKLHNVYFFSYSHQKAQFEKISYPKTQYTYRFMYVADGMLDVYIGGTCERVRQGDILYITPGDFYRLSPLDTDFSVYNIFFDMCAGTKPFEQTVACIFEEEYKKELCSKKSEFSDAVYLNKSGVFRNENCKNLIENIIYADKTDEFYDFFTSAEIRAVFAEVILSKPRTERTKNTAGDKIVEYIRQNYDKDITAKTISQEFSYHPNHINKLVRQKTGKNLTGFIRHIRIGCAVGLLYENDASLSEIASRLGYYDYSHFYKAFVAETGVSPTEYKQKK